MRRSISDCGLAPQTALSYRDDPARLWSHSAPCPIKRGMTMTFHRQAFALAIAFTAMPALAQDGLPRPEPDTIIFAMMSGKCRTFKVGGRDLPCRAVAFSQTEEGRANFTLAINDPKDDSHIITFSGDNGRRPDPNVYELPIDRMLLKSKDRPKVDGLPVPSIELATGLCRQVGNFVTLELSSPAVSPFDDVK